MEDRCRYAQRGLSASQSKLQGSAHGLNTSLLQGSQQDYSPEAQQQQVPACQP